MTYYIKHKIDENGAKAFQKLPTSQDVDTIRNSVDLQYLQNVNKAKLLQHNLAVDVLKKAHKFYDTAKALHSNYPYDILGPDGKYPRISNEQDRDKYIADCKLNLDNAMHSLNQVNDKIDKQPETVAKYKDVQKLKDSTKKKINDKKEKMQCVHGTNLDTLLSVMLKTDGYLLPYSKLFKLGKKELTTGENKTGTPMNKVVCAVKPVNERSALHYAIGASTKFSEDEIRAKSNEIIKDLHKTPVICYGQGTRYKECMTAVPDEVRFREVKVEFIAVHDKHYEYVKTVLDGLGVNLPVVSRDFANQSQFNSTPWKEKYYSPAYEYNTLKNNATQWDKQWEIKKRKNTQLDYTHLPSNDNENRLFDKPAKSFPAQPSANYIKLEKNNENQLFYGSKY